MDTNSHLELIRLSAALVLPELSLSVGILCVIIIGLIFKRATISYGLSLVISFINLILLVIDPVQNSITLFSGMLEQDPINYKLRLLLAASGLLVLIISNPKSVIKHAHEYYTLTLTVIVGAQLLVMSSHMAMVLLSIELMSIPSYILAGYAFQKSSAEAGVKYFIYGAMATAFMIFGFSWLYGLGQGLVLFNPAFSNTLSYNNHIVLMVAGLMIVAGLLFKMAATPFHFWAPDVYHEAPWAVLAIFSSVPKVAAGAFLIKLLAVLTLQGEAKYDWQTVIAVLAILTLTVGNFSALWQKNIKRMMAYSSIGQAGFLLCIVAMLNTQASNIFFFYVAVLVISTGLVFMLLKHFEEAHQTQTIEDFAGLGRSNPLTVALLTIGLISLTGLPITAGFTAKLMVFTGLLSTWETTGKPILMALFVFGLLNTVVALYYYLKIPYHAFLKETWVRTSKPQLLTLCIGALLAISLVVLFLWPSSLV